MTSIIRLQPLSGAQDDSPPCYVLQVDEFRFLLDCGWDEHFSMAYVDHLKKHAPSIDAVLLTYPDPYHLGALPYLVGKCGLSCDIYATIPVYKMGQMFMYDLYQAHRNTEDFDIFTLDDVDAAFDRIIQLKYSQTVSLRGKGHGLQITPIPAGHMIGGTIWKILKDGEEDIVYALDYNHKKERHLNGCILESIQRPSLLITDAFNADYVQARRRARDEQLMTQIVQTVRNSGNVLIAIDTAGRVLELAHLLDQMWRSQGSGLMAYSLAMLNNVSYNVVEFAKSQVEWMSDKIMRAFEDQRNNPFQFKHMQLCHSLAELSKVPEPKVVLASVPDLQSGFSRDLFIQWCSNPKNSIVLTSRTSPGTLARQLIDDPEVGAVDIEVRRRVRLEGAELDTYLRIKKEKTEAETKHKAEQAKKEREEMESSDESDMETETDADTSIGTKPKHDLMWKTESKSRVGFFKQAKKAHPMFPFVEERVKWDEYGELIRPDDYVILETAPAEEEKDKVKKEKEEKEAKKDVTEIPTKCIRSIQHLVIQANVQFIDFEGRSDGESIKKILAQIKPRQLILVHGTDKATRMLADFAKNTRDIVQGKVFTPKLHEVIDATRESHIFQVRLKDSLVTSLTFFKARDTELAWIDAILDTTKPKADPSETAEMETDEDKENKKNAADEPLVPSLNGIPLHLVEGHRSVFINEPRLSDFKQVLTKEGFQAEFNGGVLICNNVVAIRRNETGKMQLEGALCEEYYRVRDLLYEQYAIV